MRRRLNRKAISPLIATLLLIGVVVAIGGFLWWYTTGFAKGAARTVQITPTAVLHVTSDTAAITVSIRNDGTQMFTVSKVQITSGGKTVDLMAQTGATKSGPNPLTHGDTFSITYVETKDAASGKFYIGGAANGVEIVPGKTYTIVVETDQGVTQTSVEAYRA